MSTIESQAGPIDAYRRTRTPDVQLPGVTGTLSTPGLAITPVASEGMQTAESLLQAFSSINGASARIVANRAAEAARAKEVSFLERQHAEEVAAADRGAANINAGTDLPGILSGIESGAIRPGEGESVSDAAKRIALDGTDGLSDVARQQRLARLSDNVATALQSRVDRNIKTARADNAVLAVQSIDGARSATDGHDAVQAIRKIDPDISEAAAVASVGQRWLSYAVANNDTESLAAARAFLGDQMQTEQIRAQHTYDANLKAKQADAEQATERQFYRLANEHKDKLTGQEQAFYQNVDSGTPNFLLRDFVDRSDLLPAKKVQLKSFIDERERGQLTDAQNTSVNGLRRDVVLGRFPTDDTGKPSPEKMADEVINRMDLPESDPQHIPAGTGQNFLNELQGRLQFNVRESRILADMKTVGTGTSAVAPALPTDNAAFTSALVKSGAVAGTIDQHGQPVVTGINDPIAVARFSSEFARVPTDVSNLLASGLGSSDGRQMADAATTYAALYLQSPELAASMDLGPTAKLRARFIQARLEREGRSGLTDATLLTDANYLSKTVGGIARDALKLTPQLAEYKPGDVQAVVYGVADGEKESATKIRAGATNDIRSAIFANDEAKAAGIAPRTSLSFLTDQGVSLDAVPVNVRDAYLSALDEEFRFARAVTPSDAIAITTAKKWAAQRTIADHPPFTWGGTVYFGVKGQPIVSGTALYQDVADSLGGGPVTVDGKDILQSTVGTVFSLGTPLDATDRQRRAHQTAAHLAVNTIPEWNAASGGFVFRNKGTSELYSLDGGGAPLVVNPFAPKEKTDAQRSIETIDANRAKRGK